MSKTVKIIYACLIAVTVIFLAVTLSIPNHGNGNGWEYGNWTGFVLYPLYYIVLGIALGLFLSPKQICIHFAVLYGITFVSFFRQLSGTRSARARDSAICPCLHPLSPVLHRHGSCHLGNQKTYRQYA